ncbi:MAG: dethiobiotin synthase [Candidatus Thiodiazotropha sp. (ex Monitilora ramsayi)]|nr:dethiobiotin synthase [Candidatus Thiodiazotropha sp. (ex Monitilora ramsayi)]
MARGLFITGTDTGCGKTEITLGLMHWLQCQGLTVMGMKPVASGAVRTPEGLRNDDAERIQSQCSKEVPYEWVNPFAYESPIAPHLAAESAERPINLQTIVEYYKRLSDMADWVLVEGVGGWCVPLDGKSTVADLVRLLDLPVILVVGMRLGCINHALLTEAHIQQSGTKQLGWVANQVDPAMAALEGNVKTISDLIDVPCLCRVPFLSKSDPVRVGECFRNALGLL